MPAPGAYNQPSSGGQAVQRLPDAKYGEQQQYMAQQQSAPLANSDQSAIAPSPSPSAVAGAAPPAGQPDQQLGAAGLPMAPQPSQPLTPLGAPTQRPDEPITSGVPTGAGPNTLPGQTAVPLSDALSPYFAADTTGVLAALANNLSQRGMW